MPELTAARFVITGRVQGVNFRYATYRVAHQLRLSGWVRNRGDGAVEVMAQGHGGAVERLAEFLAEGPRYAVVAGVQRSAADLDPALRGFDIRP